MKKNNLNMWLVATIAVFTACSVEPVTPQEPNNDSYSAIPNEIVCEINPDDAITRTQYADNTTFSWTTGDAVRLPVIGTTSNTGKTNCYGYTTSDGGSSSATFTRDGGDHSNIDDFTDPSNHSSLNYAIYPGSIFGAYNGWFDSGVWDDGNNHPVVELSANYSYNKANPINSAVGVTVPLIGRKINGKYNFSTAVGLLKIRITGLKTTTTKVSLSSLNNFLSGKFAVSDESETVSMIKSSNVRDGEGEHAVSLTTSAPTLDETMFFPIPVGTYAAQDLSIKIKEQSGETYKVVTKRITKEIHASRNEVLSVPDLSLSSSRSVSVDDAIQTKPQMSFSSNTSTKPFRFTVTTSSDFDVTAFTLEGMKYPNSSNGSFVLTNKPGSGDGFTFGESGKYYLQYMFLNTSASLAEMNLTSCDDNRILEYGCIPFNYYKVNVNDISGEYKINNNSSYTVTIAATTAEEKAAGHGDIKITHFYGESHDPSNMDMCIYGTVNGNSIQFDSPESTPENYTYALGGATSNSAIGMQATIYSSTRIYMSSVIRLYQLVNDEWVDQSYNFSAQANLYK